MNEPPVTNDDPAKPAPPGAGEIVAADRLNAETAGNGSDNAPPVEVTGERVGDSDRSGLIALFSVGVALSIIVHAAFLGAGLLRLPLNGPVNEEALPVTIVPDQPQPETEAKPEPETPAAEAPPAPETPAPTEERKPPETEQEKAAPASQPVPQSQPQSAQTAPAPATAPPDMASAVPPPPAPSIGAGPGEGVVGDKLAESVVAELRAAIKRCWTIPPGWKNPHQVTVVLDVRLDRNGALASHPVLLEFSASELGMAAAKNALAAVAKCAPYKLPADKFGQWRETQVRLAPE